MASIDWSMVAVEDLSNIRDYIARDAPMYGQQFVEKILAAVEKLAEFPLLGRQVPEANDAEIRELLFQSYRILYRVEASAQRVLILAVVHGRRSLEGDGEQPWEMS